MGKKILVTGAGGFIGSHLTEELVRQGHSVRALVRYNGRDDRGSLADLPGEIQSAIEVDRGDLKDPGAVRKAVDGLRVGLPPRVRSIAIPYSYQNPYDVVQTNVLGTAHVLDACRVSDCLERVILTSTSEVYGTAQRVPIDEHHPLQGQSPYAATKIAADALGESYHRSFGLPVAILRPFNTFGPRQSARAIIPTIISQALAQAGGETRPPRPAPRPDLRQGHRRRLHRDRRLRSSCSAASSTSDAARIISIGELVELIGRRLGRTITVRSEQERHRPAKSEVERLLAGTALAQSLWGWKPRYSLEAGLDETIEWVRSHIDRFRVDSYVT